MLLHLLCHQFLSCLIIVSLPRLVVYSSAAVCRGVRCLLDPGCLQLCSDRKADEHLLTLALTRAFCELRGRGCDDNNDNANTLNGEALCKQFKTTLGQHGCSGAAWKALVYRCFSSNRQSAHGHQRLGTSATSESDPRQLCVDRLNRVPLGRVLRP